MASPDLDQDISPVPRSREENQERYVLLLMEGLPPPSSLLSDVYREIKET
jgi:hypothetical protein